MAHQLQDVTSAQIASLAQEVSQLQQRQDATAAKMGSDAAATRAQVAELRQWFDANQVRTWCAERSGCSHSKLCYGITVLGKDCAAKGQALCRRAKSLPTGAIRHWAVTGLCMTCGHQA